MRDRQRIAFGDERGRIVTVAPPRNHRLTKISVIAYHDRDGAVVQKTEQEIAESDPDHEPR
jgi:hypothetical protein